MSIKYQETEENIVVWRGALNPCVYKKLRELARAEKLSANAMVHELIETGYFVEFGEAEPEYDPAVKGTPMRPKPDGAIPWESRINATTYAKFRALAQKHGDSTNARLHRLVEWAHHDRLDPRPMFGGSDKNEAL